LNVQLSVSRVEVLVCLSSVQFNDEINSVYLITH